MTSEPARRTIDVQAFIDAHGLSSMQRRLIALCFLVVAFDGFDTAIIGFIGPAVRAEWKLDVTQLGPLFAAGLFGLMIGAFLVGPLADRFGRTRMLMI
jgi:AAHS family 4-hydroxybenzoate transporter-like MFS transporter